MNEQDRQEIMDSLTESQRRGIANIIEKANIVDTWDRVNGDSFCVQDAEATLKELASYFRTYDSESVLD
jgi:hypothetical protein